VNLAERQGKGYGDHGEQMGPCGEGIQKQQLSLKGDSGHACHRSTISRLFFASVLTKQRIFRLSRKRYRYNANKTKKIPTAKLNDSCCRKLKVTHRHLLRKDDPYKVSNTGKCTVSNRLFFLLQQPILSTFILFTSDFWENKLRDHFDLKAFH